MINFELRVSFKNPSMSPVLNYFGIQEITYLLFTPHDGIFDNLSFRTQVNLNVCNSYYGSSFQTYVILNLQYCGYLSRLYKFPFKLPLPTDPILASEDVIASSEWITTHCVKWLARALMPLFKKPAHILDSIYEMTTAL